MVICPKALSSLTHSPYNVVGNGWTQATLEEASRIANSSRSKAVCSWDNHILLFLFKNYELSLLWVFGSLSADLAAVYEAPGCFTSFNSYLDLSILYCSHGILEPNMGLCSFLCCIFPVWICPGTSASWNSLQGINCGILVFIINLIILIKKNFVKSV